MRSSPVSLLLCKITYWLMPDSLFEDSSAKLFHFLLKEDREGKKQILSGSSHVNFTGAVLLKNGYVLQPGHSHFTSLKKVNIRKRVSVFTSSYEDISIMSISYI